MPELRAVQEVRSPRTDHLSNTEENLSTTSAESNSDLDKSKASFSNGLMTQLLHENATLAKRVDEIEKRLTSQSNHLSADISSMLAQRVNDLESDVSLAIRDLLNFRRHLDFQIEETFSRQDGELKKVNDSVQALTLLVRNMLAMTHLTGAVRCMEAPTNQADDCSIASANIPNDARKSFSASNNNTMQEDVLCLSVSVDRVGMRRAPGLGSSSLPQRVRNIMEGEGSLAPQSSSRECEAQLIHYPSLAQVAPQNETRGIERSRSTSTSRYTLDEKGSLQGEAEMLDRMIHHSKTTLGKIRTMAQGQPIAKQCQQAPQLQSQRGSVSPTRQNSGAIVRDLSSSQLGRPIQGGSATLPVGTPGGTRVLRGVSTPLGTMSYS